MALFYFTKSIIEGKPIDVFNYGNHRRDFTYIDDIVEGVIRTLDSVATPNSEWDSAQPDRAPVKRRIEFTILETASPLSLITTLKSSSSAWVKKRKKIYCHCNQAMFPIPMQT